MPMHDSIKSSFDPDAIKYLQAPMKRPAGELQCPRWSVGRHFPPFGPLPGYPS